MPQTKDSFEQNFEQQDGVPLYGLLPVNDCQFIKNLGVFLLPPNCHAFQLCLLTYIFLASQNSCEIKEFFKN